MGTGTKAVLAVLAMIPFIVLVQNAAETEFRFLFWSLALPRALLLLLFLLAGVGLGLLWCAWRARRRASR